MSTPTRASEQRAEPAPLELGSLLRVRRRRMLMIVNPYATSVSARMRALVLSALRRRFDVDAVDTAARGHATELCREAAHEGYDVVVTLGGDGTVNEAANGLRGAPTPLCCLPGGNNNVFGKLLGIPAELVDATEHLLGMADDWHPRRVDLGVVNGRCFTFASGVGLDASVVERVDASPRMKARFGPYYYVWVALITFPRRYLLRPRRMRVRAGGRSLEGVTTIVQNGSFYTYFQNRPIEMTDGAELDSGAFAGAVLRRATLLGMPSIGWRALSRRARLVGHRQVTGLPDLTEMTVQSADGRSLPLQVDGDYLGDVAEARYSILPDALTVVA